MEFPGQVLCVACHLISLLCGGATEITACKHLFTSPLLLCRILVNTIFG